MDQAPVEQVVLQRLARVARVEVAEDDPSARLEHPVGPVHQLHDELIGEVVDEADAVDEVLGRDVEGAAAGREVDQVLVLEREHLLEPALVAPIGDERQGLQVDVDPGGVQAVRVRQALVDVEQLLGRAAGEAHDAGGAVRVCVEGRLDLGRQQAAPVLHGDRRRHVEEAPVEDRSEAPGPGRDVVVHQRDRVEVACVAAGLRVPPLPVLRHEQIGEQLRLDSRADGLTGHLVLAGRVPDDFVVKCWKSRYACLDLGRRSRGHVAVADGGLVGLRDQIAKRVDGRADLRPEAGDGVGVAVLVGAVQLAHQPPEPRRQDLCDAAVDVRAEDGVPAPSPPQLLGLDDEGPGLLAGHQERRGRPVVEEGQLAGQLARPQRRDRAAVERGSNVGQARQQDVQAGGAERRVDQPFARAVAPLHAVVQEPISGGTAKAVQEMKTSRHGRSSRARRLPRGSHAGNGRSPRLAVARASL
jgi:hypothetical protein